MAGKFALIIGNSTYQDTNLGKLNAPANDVRALADALMDPGIGGFDEVKTLLDRPFSVLQPEIIAFFDGKQPDDTLLFYFSGHGLLDEGGRLFLATIETRSNRPRALSIPATLIADEMGSSRSRRQVLIFDCCHSGAFLAENAKGGQPVRTVHTEDIFRGSGRTVLTASDTTEYAFEGSDARSVFTRALVEGLRTGDADQDNDQFVSVDEWYDYAFEYVMHENPRQTPMKANYGMRGKLYIARVPSARPEKEKKVAEAPVMQTKARYNTWLVHPYGRGDFYTISEAIAAANTGDRIEIYAGLYEESLSIEKPLEIVGLGNLGDVVVQIKDKSVVHLNAIGGRIANITFAQMGGQFHCIDIAHGSFEIEGCDISSSGSSAAIGIHGKTKPVIRRNIIHHVGCGIHVYDQGLGFIESNDISNFENPAIAVMKGGNPIIRGNKIHDGKSNGVRVFDMGLGLFDSNEIYNVKNPGLAIDTGGNPTVRGNKIHNGSSYGVSVNENGLGVVENNDIYNNGDSGIAVLTGGNPTVVSNRIYQNNKNGIAIWSKGAGTYRGNELSQNGEGNWYISSDSEKLIVREANQEK